MSWHDVDDTDLLVAGRVEAPRLIFDQPQPGCHSLSPSPSFRLAAMARSFAVVDA